MPSRQDDNLRYYTRRFCALILLGLLHVLFVVFLVGVFTDAGVLKMLAGGAVFEVKIEADDGGLFLRAHLDLHDGGNVQSRRQSLVGEERFSFQGEFHASGLGALSADDGDRLLAGCVGLAAFVQKGDLELAILGHQELGVRFDFMKHFASIGSGHGGVVVVMMLVIVVFGRLHVGD